MDKVEKAVDPKIKKLLLSLFVLFIMTNLMVQAFVTASPLIAKSFKITASLSSMQSTITTLAMGVGSVIFGTLSDYIPARKLLLFGVTLISVGSIIGFAFQSFYVSIIIARALQSLGQATISSLVIVIISRYISGKAKVRYFCLLHRMLPSSTISWGFNWWLNYSLCSMASAFIITFSSNLLLTNHFDLCA